MCYSLSSFFLSVFAVFAVLEFILSESVVSDTSEDFKHLKHSKLQLALLHYHEAFTVYCSSVHLLVTLFLNLSTSKFVS